MWPIITHPRFWDAVPRNNRLECRYDTLGGSGPKLNDFMVVGEIVCNDNVVESFQCEQMGRDFLPRVIG